MSANVFVRKAAPRRAPLPVARRAPAAVTPPHPERAPAPAAPSDAALLEAAGWRGEDLFAIAEIAHHFLMSGGVELAVALFEGLAAAAPNEPYFALGLGLSLDHRGDPEGAERWYAKASALDPGDGRPDVNRAELCLERGDRARALELFQRGARKARLRSDEALERKARAVIAHLTAGGAP